MYSPSIKSLRPARIRQALLRTTVAAALVVVTAAMAPMASAAAAKPSSSGKTAVRPAATSGTLSYADIEGYWIAAGGPPDQAQTAAAIAAAESTYRPGVIQQGVEYCGSSEAGWGLWQITCGNSVPQFGQNFQLLDPWNNAEAAVWKYNNKGGSFEPWVTYTNGKYLAYLQNVPPNLAVTDPGEYVQDGSTPSGTPASPVAFPR